MEKDHSPSKRPYQRHPLQCRLCLCEYDKTQLCEIFAKDSQQKESILAAVSVYRQDLVTRICISCQEIVQLINTFRAFCQQSEVLLAQRWCVLDSDNWACPDNTIIFRQATELVRQHLHRIEAFSSQNDCIDNIKKGLLEVENYPQEEHYLEPSIADAVDETSEFLNGKQGHTVELLLETEQSAESRKYGIIEEVNFEDSDSCQDDEQGHETPERAKRGRVKSANKSDRPEKVICSICGELVSQQGLEGHLNRHLGVQPFACDIEGCGAKLYSKFALQQHRSRHKSTNRYYDCEVCGKRIKGTAYWLIHRKIHTDEPRFQCDICGKKFRRKCKLKVHSTVHSGIAEFPCEICGKYFTVKHNLTAHYKLHMKNGTYPKDADFIMQSQKVRQMQE
ncbi:zinc finger protein 567-like isoform X2 [Toxorhynchites rutilus septentrionalis]|uniref:zinc finger protein 567-like isoform X2 n=1 Tax=Toxorhynchites rutilus septentrionalis TaxID=329112 RepID=UPI0024784ED5|nr:zinc finger protein 567-like isoform X2 [Toxorhynchites rutilus septentrionalis]